MMPTAVWEPWSRTSSLVLHAHLLGQLDYDAALRLQRQLVYEVAGDEGRAALILCEHPPLITIGRQGSTAHLDFVPGDPEMRDWPVRWVNRGGGCLPHGPGQLAIYPIFPLRQLGMGLEEYLDRLHRVVIAVLDDFSVHAHVQPGRAGVWTGNRLIAGVGVAVRDWVTWHGVALNINPDLMGFRVVHPALPGDGPMTSLARERGGPVRPALIRERLIEHFVNEFGFGRTSLFFAGPGKDRAWRDRVLVPAVD